MVMFSVFAARRAPSVRAAAASAAPEVDAARRDLPDVFRRALATPSVRRPEGAEEDAEVSPRSPKLDKILTNAIELVDQLEQAVSNAGKTMVAHDKSEAVAALRVVNPALKAAKAFYRELHGKEVSQDARLYVAKIRELTASLEESQLYLTDLKDYNKDTADRHKDQRETLQIWIKSRELGIRLHVLNQRISAADKIEKPLRQEVESELKALEDLRQEANERLVETGDVNTFREQNEYLTKLAEEIEWQVDKKDEQLPGRCRSCHPLARRVEKAADKKANCPVGRAVRSILHPYAFPATCAAALYAPSVVSGPIVGAALVSTARCEQRHGCLQRAIAGTSLAHVKEVFGVARKPIVGISLLAASLYFGPVTVLTATALA